MSNIAQGYWAYVTAADMLHFLKNCKPTLDNSDSYAVTWKFAPPLRCTAAMHADVLILATLIQRPASPILPLRCIVCLACLQVNIYKSLQDIAAGMDYLHTVGVLHGDLKGANVLLKSTATDPRGFMCKLADFGLSRVLDLDMTHISTHTYGTISYMPPELLSQGKMTRACDVYSFGMLSESHSRCKMSGLLLCVAIKSALCPVGTCYMPALLVDCDTLMILPGA